MAGDLDNKIDQLAQEISSRVEAGGKTKIAVIEFSDLRGNVTDFGMFLAEELITKLFSSARFEVIERQLLNKIMQEHKLSLTGAVDPTSAKELGKILGVDAIVSGTVTDLGKRLKINARLISTETGNVFSAAGITVQKDEEVRQLLARVVPSAQVGGVAEPEETKGTEGIVPSPGIETTYEPGLLGKYYNSFDWKTGIWPDYPSLERIDKIINFNWAGGSPAGRIEPNNFGVRWTGEIFAPRTGVYFLSAQHDDGLRVFINKSKVIERWASGVKVIMGVRRNRDFVTNAEIHLQGGRWYPIVIEYFEGAGPSKCILNWAPPGQTEPEVIQSKFLRTPAK